MHTGASHYLFWPHLCLFLPFRIKGTSCPSSCLAVAWLHFSPNPIFLAPSCCFCFSSCPAFRQAQPTHRNQFLFHSQQKHFKSTLQPQALNKSIGGLQLLISSYLDRVVGAMICPELTTFFLCWYTFQPLLKIHTRTLGLTVRQVYSVSVSWS